MVSNSGKINANGGTVFLSAATAANILRNAVNIPGSIRANSVGTHDGRIVINGGGGRVSLTGRLAANGGRHGKGGTISVATAGDLAVSGQLTAKSTTATGGEIDLTGANVAVVAALIDASGATGGGLVRIGGTFQGGNGDPASDLYTSYIGRFGTLQDLASAQTVTIDAATTINVSAKGIGDAGTAIVWSEQNTSFAGTILAQGGAQGGNGGFVETSGQQGLAVLDQGVVNTLASNGATGNWLLDPKNLTIATGGTGAAITSDPFSTDPTGSDTIAPSAIQGAATNVTLQASTDITVSNAITMTNSVVLTFNAGRSIIVNANITSKGGFTATIDDAGATVRRP